MRVTVYIDTVTGRLTKLLAQEREERLADDARIETWLRLADQCLLPTTEPKRPRTEPKIVRPN